MILRGWICAGVMIGGGVAAHADVTIEHHGRYDAPFAVVTLWNTTESGKSVSMVTLDTAHGPVVLEHEITWNYRPDPRDALRVLELPVGVIAVPQEVWVDEQSFGEIELYLWSGS